jgi:Holliday junction resolvasome RuvABC endonuclease subunit
MKKKMKKIAGIDFSLSSPAVCVYTGNNFNYKDCTFYFLTDRKKNAKYYNRNLVGAPMDPYFCQEERYHHISSWVLKCLAIHHVDKVYIEDYAFAATGRVFHIAENCGVLKYRMWLSNYEVTPIAPTQIKKFATGKGNANKEDMQVAFIDETGYDPKLELNLTDKQWNPSSDIIDSYYICKYGNNLLTIAQ